MNDTGLLIIICASYIIIIFLLAFWYKDAAALKFYREGNERLEGYIKSQDDFIDDLTKKLRDKKEEKG